MNQARAHWRVRISTLMLAVIIVALAITLLIERRRRLVAVQILQARLAEVNAQLVQERKSARDFRLNSRMRDGRTEMAEHEGELLVAPAR